MSFQQAHVGFRISDFGWNHSQSAIRNPQFRWGASLLFVALACGSGPTVAEAFSFSIEPSRIELSIPAGKQRGKTVRIDNRKSEEPLHITVYAQDVVFLPDGTSEFAEPGSTTWSCARWVKVVPEEVDIPPGKSQEVRVSVAVPEGARGGYYAMVFFESRPSYVEKGLGINFRIGALTEVSIPKTEVYQAKLVQLAWPEPHEIQVEIYNEGNVLIRPKGTLKLFNAQKRKVAQLELNPQRLGILPKTARSFHVSVNSVEPGTYELRVEIDYGAPYLLVGERTIHVK